LSVRLVSKKKEYEKRKKKKEKKKKKLTRVNILIYAPLPGALVPLGDGLRLELRAVDVAVGVHGLLEGVVLPAEDVVAVVAEPGAVPLAPDKRLLGRVGRPQGLVVELGRVPDGLEEELGDLDGVGVGAFPVGFEGS